MKKIKNQLFHTPVLINETIKYLSIKENYIYVDGTFGDGGHSKAILEENNTCKVLAIDRDPTVLKKGILFTKKYKGRFKLVLDRISNIEQIVIKEKLSRIHGILFDLGVSTRQLKDPKRGFSFKEQGPLDMRMEKKGVSAEELLNNTSEKQLADIIFNFGDEKEAKRIARAIHRYKKNKKINSSVEFSNIINSAKKYKKSRINPSTKTFQAIRIFINKEIDELKQGLKSAKKILTKSGKLVVISFHSLEDKIVKDFLNTNSRRINNKSRYLPQLEPNITLRPSFKILTKKVIVPTASEIKSNFYSRSAKLRAAERL